MRRVPLSTLLIAANLGLLAIAAAGVAWLAKDLPAQVAVDPRQAQVSFVRALLGWSLIVAAAAILANILIGRQLSQPLRRLTNDAARIGYGDLAAPIAPASGDELGTLATALEDMRGRLLSLMADLRRQQGEADAILTGIVEGVFAVDRERRVRYLNPQAAALLGIAPAQALGRFCGDVLNPQGLAGMRPCEEQCPIVHARFRAGARATEHLLLAGGQRRTVVITSAASAAPSGEHSPAHDLRQVVVVRDETELEATRRLRDTVLANVSHEFRTPLSAQLASIELLLDQLPDLTTDQVAELVISLQRGTLRLTHLIDNLLESVRLEAGQFAIRQQTVALDEVVEAALELVRPLHDQRGQTVQVELPYPLPQVCGDAARLTQVMVNLLANANKYAPAGSTIWVGAAAGPETVALWVEDNGPGLPDLPQPDLFAPFARFVGSAAAEPEPAGAGLGLWIVKSIVERHGGRVEAKSSAEGTRMVVILPHLEARGPAAS
jgi:signal transduction histidine kinase/HAMP domain-containing protein